MKSSAKPVKLGSRYDPNVTAYDPFPYAPQQETNDPILLSIIAPTTTAMVDFRDPYSGLEGGCPL